jgi:hypothetical protein
MPRPRFNDVKECLLRAGVAPRHVRRYIGELGDHFDDLVGEEISRGLARGTAEHDARARLGSNQDLTKVMLDRPELRSLSARYPWAIFILGPIMLPVVTLVAAVFIETASFNVISTFYKNPTHLPPPTWFVDVVAAWNWSATHALPLAIAILLCLLSIRQRTKPTWTFAAVTIACLVGAFQQLSWQDDGYHGQLWLGSGLFPPFPRDMLIAGIWRALADVAIVSIVWVFATRGRRLRPTAVETFDRLLSTEIGSS